MNRKIFLILSFLCCVLAIFAGEVRIGDKNITIPQPAGFAAANPDTVKTLTQFMPPNVRILGCFIDSSDAARIIAGGEAEFQRYIFFATDKSVENVSLSPAMFAQLKQELHSSFDNLAQKAETIIDEVQKKFSEVYSSGGKNAGIEIKLTPLGIDFENENIIIFSLLMPTTVKINENKVQVAFAGSFAIVRVRDKMISVYVYRQFKNAEDLEWTRQTAEQLAEALISTN